MPCSVDDGYDKGPDLFLSPDRQRTNVSYEKSLIAKYEN